MIQDPINISHALLIVLHGHHSGVPSGDSHCLVMDAEETIIEMNGAM